MSRSSSRKQHTYPYILPPLTLVLHCLSCLELRIRFLFGGQHGEFRYLPPPGFTPCSDALLPKVKLKVEACQKYIFNDGEGKQDLFGPLIPTTPVVFIPAPVDTSKVKNIEIVSNAVRVHLFKQYQQVTSNFNSALVVKYEALLNYI